MVRGLKNTERREEIRMVENEEWENVTKDYRRNLEDPM